ncbi:hypothetical protein SLS62_000442 [Diatrype stigma]|uniref:Major facilitator superfamily (MFS) profile domain-containing protein n=1 Tax=Diatrype stigma TaxID=117547 RepID=A0AAN9YSI9_9PEZI
MLRSIASASFLASAAITTVSAHQNFHQFWVNDVSPGYQVGIRMPPSNNPVTDVTSNDIICNVDGTDGTGVETVAASAGDTITVQWDQSTHPSPITHFLYGPVDSAAATSGVGAGWFKIDELDYEDGQWANEIMSAADMKRSFQLPANLASGEYLLRSEMLALHGAQEVNGAQFYIGCAQLKITGPGGSCSPEISLPGAYGAEDPNIYIPNFYNGFDPTTYSAPGGEVASCGTKPPETELPDMSGSKFEEAPTPTPTPAPAPEPGVGHVGDPTFGVDEKKLVAKLDRNIVPLVMLLYTFSFLDRVNIGNARLYDMESDLGLTGNQYQIAVSILFVTYLLFEVPSNLILKPLTPQRYISFISFTWGIVAMCTGFVHNYGELIAVRLILGALEAGLFPGLTVYLTFYYTKGELALRVGYLFVSAAVAGALGGLLAYGIGHLAGVGGLSGWRWIMIIEGLPSIALGAAVFFLLPNDPAHARFLTDAEKQLMVARFRRHYGDTASAQEFSKEDMLAAFTDWKVWAFVVAQFGADTMLYGYSTFLPTIIKGLGEWSTAEIQLLTIPCYFIGAVTYMAVAWISDRKQMRGIFCVIFGCVSVVGYGILLSDSTAGVHYFGAILVATGLYVVVGLPLAWLPNNSPRYGKRTTANGMQLTGGNASGIMTPFIYLSTYAPRYIQGNAVSLSMVAMATGIYGFLWYRYDKENKKRVEGPVNAKHENLSEEQLAELGDESPHYRYTI